MDARRARILPLGDEWSSNQQEGSLMVVLNRVVKCAGCNKPVESYGCGETWHLECWQNHNRAACNMHNLCRKEEAIASRRW